MAQPWMNCLGLELGRLGIVRLLKVVSAHVTRQAKCWRCHPIPASYSSHGCRTSAQHTLSARTHRRPSGPSPLACSDGHELPEPLPRLDGSETAREPVARDRAA